MIKILTPPLPLPYKGGEGLPPCPPQGLREALPSLQGEGQGWGLDSALPLGLSKNFIHLYQVIFCISQKKL